MVFESIVVDILNYTLGDYFENLDTSQLRVGIWGGDVVLRELYLKHSVMDDLGLPFKVIVGKVGTLRMKIPWQNIYTSPVVLNLQNLLLIITPSYAVSYNQNVEEKSLKAAKDKELARLDSIRAQQRLKKEEQVHHEDSFSEKLITQIVKNVQIHIDCIHIRYEDDVTRPDSPFAFGVTLKSLQIDTTNENWVPTVLSETVESIHKLATLESLSLYWNSKTEMIKRTELKTDMLQILQEMVVKENSNLVHLLGPISSSAKLKLTPNPERGQMPFSKPKLWIDLFMEELRVGITNLQFQDIMELIEALDFMTRAQYYRKYRPNLTVHNGHYREWWLFAFKCILEEDVRRRRQNWDWMHMKRHRRLCRTYADAYYLKLTSKKLKKETVLQLQKCEDELNVFNITLVRKQVEVKIEREVQRENKKIVVTENKGWLSGWFGGGPSSPNGGETSKPSGSVKDNSVGDIVQKFEAAMTPEEKAKLYAAIDYTENTLPFDYPDEFEEYSLKFCLNKLVVTVKDVLRKDPNTTGDLILNMGINMVETKVATRPVKHGMRVNVVMGKLEAEGFQGKRDKYPPKIVTSKTSDANTHLLKIDFENNPLNSQVRQILKVQAQPIEVVYHGKTAVHLARCFTLPSEMQLNKLQAAAASTLIEWREQSAAGLQHLIDTRGEIDLNVDLVAPYFLIPKHGRLSTNSSVLIVDLGELKIRSKPRHKGMVLEMFNSQNQQQIAAMKKAAYDTMFIELKEFQILLALPGEKLLTTLIKEKLSRGKKSIPLTFLKSDKLLLQLDQSLIPDDPRFPKLQMEGHLPVLNLDLTENRLLELVNLLVTLPLPHTDVSDAVGSTAISSISEDPTVSESYAISRITYGESSQMVKTKPTTDRVEFIEFVFKFTLESIKIRITRVSSLQEHIPFVDFELSKFHVKFTSNTSSSLVDVSIGGLTLQSLQQNATTTPKGSLCLLRTPSTNGSEHHLLKIYISSVVPENPKLAGKVKQVIRIEIKSLNVNLDLAVIQYFKSFGDEITLALGGKKEAKAMESLETVSTASMSSVNSMIKRGERRVRKQLSRMAVRADDDGKSLKADFKLEPIEFIFVEKVDSVHTNAVLVNLEISFNINKTSGVTTIIGIIEGVQLNTCNFDSEQKLKSLAEVISSSTVTLLGKQSNNTGLEMEVSLSDIFIRLSAGTVELFSKISDAFKVSPSTLEESKVVVDYTNHWDKKHVSTLKIWYLEPGAIDERNCVKREAPDAPIFDEEELPMPDIDNSKERLILKSGSIVLSFEAGSEVITAPLLLIEASLNIYAIDWSDSLEIGGGIQMAAAYFNAGVGMWEYLIEPVSKGSYHSTVSNPLELQFSLNQGETDEFSKMVKEAKSSLVCVHGHDENNETSTAAMKRSNEIVVSIQCNEVIELTLTQMAIHVLQMLGDTFSNARKLHVTNKKDISTAPYIIENFTGHEFVFDLNKTPFLAEDTSTGDFMKGFKVKSGHQVELIVEKDSNRHSILKEQQPEKNRWIRVFCPSLSFQTKLPLSKAETRSFTLPSGNILVADVWVKDCSRVVTFRGNVQILNELNVPVDVLTSDMEHITTLDAKRPTKIPYSIPLKYLTSGGFFFAPARFRQTDLSFEIPAIPRQGYKTTSYLSCNDFVGKNIFYIKVVCKSRQLLRENSKQLSLTGWNHTVRLEPTFLINNMLPVPICYLTERSSSNSTTSNFIETAIADRGQMIQVTNLPADAPSFELPLRVKGYDGLDWDCVIVITAATEKLSAWSFLCNTAGRILTLGIHKEITDRQYILHVYVPFWMINRTGLNLSYKSEKDKEVTKHSTETPIVLFSYPAADVFNKSNKARMKTDEADWCAPFPTETVGLSSSLKCKSAKKDYQFGITIKMCHGGLTKMIVFTPKFYVLNQCSFPLALYEGNDTTSMSLNPSTGSPYWPRGNDPHLRVRIDGTSEVSELFSYETGHTTLLRLYNRHGGIQVDVSVTAIRILITFNEYSLGKAPNLIVNLSDELTIGFRQEDQDLASQVTIQPSEYQLITWPDPTKPRNLIWYPLNADKTKPLRGREYVDSLVTDSYTEFEVNNNRYFWISFVEDLQRVTVLTKNPIMAKFLKSARDLELPTAEIVLMFSGIGISLVDNLKCREIIYIRVSSAGQIWEQETAAGKLRAFSPTDSEMLETMFQSYSNVKLPLGMRGGTSVGLFQLDSGMEVDLRAMKMLKPHRRALRRSPRQPGLWTHFKIFPHSSQCHLRINKLQIDNQLPDSTFVFLLSQIAVAKSVAVNESERKPFVELVFMQEKKAHSGGLPFMYCSLLVQEFQVRMDIGIISAVMEMFSQTGHAKIAKIMEDFRNDYSNAVMSLEEFQAKTVAQVGDSKRFYSFLHLSPLKVKFSFSMNGASNDSSNFFVLLLQGLGIDKLADFQDVQFQLACFELRNKLLSDNQFGGMVTSHYATQSLKQFYVLILGLDFLGNPYALLSGITEGIGAFFYEPIQGAILGPEAFKEGLSLGVKSLVGHTVGGAAEALSKVTGTIGKGFAAMTMDSDFQRQRNEAMRQGPQGTSLSTTATGFWKSGILDTMIGVVSNPIKGAQEEGIQGFGKGLLRGVLGVVTRPVAGAADLTRGTLDSFRRALQDDDGMDQMRPPRQVQCGAALLPFNMHAGKGYQIIRELNRKNGGQFKHDTYVTHIVTENEAILITDHRAIFLKLTDAYGGATIYWEHPWADFEIPPYVVERGMEFLLKPPPGKRNLKPESLQLYVPIHDPETCMWILHDIEELMKSDTGLDEIYDEDLD